MTGDDIPESELSHNGSDLGSLRLTEADIETLLEEGELEITIVGEYRNHYRTIEVTDRGSRTSASDSDE